MSAAKRTNQNSSKKFASRVELSGSFKKLPTGKNLGAVSLNEVIEVLVTVRRKAPLRNFIKTLGTGKNKPLTHELFDKRFGASQADIDLVVEFAGQHDLTVVQTSVSKCSVILKGTVQSFSDAFQVYLSNYSPENGDSFRGRSGVIHVPVLLSDIITGVFGLDNRPAARPMFHMQKKDGGIVHPRSVSVSYNPNDVAKAYQYPRDVDGTGQCIALIELGGGYRVADMQNYFKKLGITQPVISSKSIDGAHNSPSTPDSADGEVALDIQVAGAVAPGAAIVVYFTTNTDKGFLDAISTAIHDRISSPSVISISWGAAESQWTEQAMQNFNETFMSAAALGITITVAAGDNGSSDRVTDGKAHVDFPASSPNVLACGGTKLLLASETVWNDQDGWATGGGISDFFPVPDYQKTISLPASVNATGKKGRGLPDIAANADSASGYNVLVDGQWSVVGGTSAVAPLIAGLIALTNQKLKRKAGFIHPRIYSTREPVFKDILSGNNITANNGGYTAGPGWDACTGLGVPLGAITNIL
jgi:kumamolisin